MTDAEAIEFRSHLLAWYDAHRRDLPWRTNDRATGRPDPYHVLLSEFMLQQTQVSTVIPYFHAFLNAYPTIPDLARAPEQQVLRLWQGLGYYSRARNLLRAAQFLVEHHAGRVPTTVEALQALPGVGRYTAGAIASIAHGTRAPIVDGNVIRVVCRIDGLRADPRVDKAALAVVWTRAEHLVPQDRPGDFNSALMELGATVCIPRTPQCLICPIARFCRARELGIQDEIPPAKATKITPTEQRHVYCLYREAPTGEREYAFEQRPSSGRWAGMWQFLTRPMDAPAPAKMKGAQQLEPITHQLTHRRYEFVVTLARASSEVDGSTWLTLQGSEALPLPKPHVRIRATLRSVTVAAEDKAN